MPRFLRRGYGRTRRRRFRRFRRSFVIRFARKHTYGRFIPGAELKCVDPNDQSLYGFAAGANLLQVSCINAVMQGSGPHERIGSRIRMKTIDIRIQITAQIGATPTPGCVYRIMLIYDSQANKNPPATSDVLRSQGIAGAFSTTPMSPINITNRERFVILRDLMWNAPPAFGGVGAAATNADEFLGRPAPNHVRWFVKLRGMETTFTNSTGAIGDITTGSLLLCHIAGDAYVDTVYTSHVSARLRFMD